MKERAYHGNKPYLLMTRCEIDDHFQNCPKLFEDKTPQSTTEFFTKNSLDGEQK